MRCSESGHPSILNHSTLQLFIYSIRGRANGSSKEKTSRRLLKVKYLLYGYTAFVSSLPGFCGPFDFIDHSRSPSRCRKDCLIVIAHDSEGAYNGSLIQGVVLPSSRHSRQTSSKRPPKVLPTSTAITKMQRRSRPQILSSQWSSMRLFRTSEAARFYSFSWKDTSGTGLSILLPASAI